MAAKAKRKVKATKAAKLARAFPEVDFGPDILIDRGDRVVEHPSGRDGVRRARSVVECRLDWYYTRMLIDDRQYEAGIKFREQCKLALLQPRVSSLYGGAVSGGAGGVLPLDGLKAIRSATDALPAKMRDVLISVCADDSWASGDLPLLRDGLTALANHWRLRGDVERKAA